MGLIRSNLGSYQDDERNIDQYRAIATTCYWLSELLDNGLLHFRVSQIERLAHKLTKTGRRDTEAYVAQIHRHLDAIYVLHTCQPATVDEQQKVRSFRLSSAKA